MTIRIKGAQDGQYATLAGVTSYRETLRRVPAGLYRNKSPIGTAHIFQSTTAGTNTADVPAIADTPVVAGVTLTACTSDIAAHIAPRQKWEEVRGLYIAYNSATIPEDVEVRSVSSVAADDLITIGSANSWRTGDIVTASITGSGFTVGTEYIITGAETTGQTFKLLRDGVILDVTGSTTFTLTLVFRANLPENILFIPGPFSLSVIS